MLFWDWPILFCPRVYTLEITPVHLREPYTHSFSHGSLVTIHLLACFWVVEINWRTRNNPMQTRTGHVKLKTDSNSSSGLTLTL